MNCRNSDLPDTAMAPSCGCGRSLSDISGPGPVVRPVANFVLTTMIQDFR